jgi:hypothetical protein
MAKRPQQRGPLTDRFNRRFGVEGIGIPEGVNTEVSPSLIRREQFRRLINARWRGDGVVPRAGQLLLSGVIHSASAGIYPTDFAVGTPKRLWTLGSGCPGESVGVGFSISHFDQEQEPPYQRAVWFASATQNIALGTYGGIPHVGLDAELRRLQLVKVPWGTENLSVSGSSQSLPLDSYAGYKFNAMLEVGGIFYLALEDGGGNGKIVAWDGKTSRNDLTGITAPKALGKWRDQLVVGFAAAANKIMIRAQGSTSPGTYSTVVPGAGTVASFTGINSIVSFKDAVFIADGAANVWRYDGTTLAVFRNVVGAVIPVLAVGFGFLFYGYASAGAHAVIGRTDGVAAFVDAHKDITSQDATVTSIHALAYYRDNLAAGGKATLTPFQSKIFVSRGPATSGTYDAHLPNNLAYSTLPTDLRYFMVS